MNIIRMLGCWLKIRFIAGLSADDFCALCTEFDCKKSKMAEKVLRRYFQTCAVSDTEVDRICKGSDDLRMLYFNNIRHGRRLSLYEQGKMLSAIPISRLSKFPSRLHESYLLQLFEEQNKSKFVAYSSSFNLPTDLELRLIDLCSREDKEADFAWNSYRYILLRYLEADNGDKLQTPEVQLAVLALDDKDLALALVKNCTMSENRLFVPTMQYLVDHAERDVLSSLLLHSFIASDELVKKMLARFEDLRWMYEISRLRRPLRRLEIDSNRFLGIESPSQEEFMFIMQTIERNEKNLKRTEFVHDVLIPMLRRRDVTPYFCAWAADEFPEVSEKAYRSVRATAEAYRDFYKSN